MRLLQKHEDWIQPGSALLAAVLTAWQLARRGWSVWEWLPLAFLASLGMALLWVLAWFLERKLTYQKMAADNKADLEAGGDGWPRHRRN